jgi:hypothetical protein
MHGLTINEASVANALCSRDVDAGLIERLGGHGLSASPY